MSAVHSKDSRVLVNERHVSGAINGWTVTGSREYGDASNLLSVGEQWAPGLAGGMMTLAGLLDSTVGLEDEIGASAGTDNGVQVMAAPSGWTVGQDALCAVADPSKLAVDSKVKGVVSVSVDAKPDNGVDWGTILAAHAQVSATGNGTTVDQTAATTTGGAAYLHCTEFTGLTNIAVVVQDSADGSTWATIATFTTLTAVGFEAKTIAGTIRRYVRAVRTVSGTGTATFAVALARR